MIFLTLNLAVLANMNVNPNVKLKWKTKWFIYLAETPLCLHGKVSLGPPVAPAAPCNRRLPFFRTDFKICIWCSLYTI